MDLRTFADGAPSGGRPRARVTTHVDTGVPLRAAGSGYQHGSPMPPPHRPAPAVMVAVVEGLRGLSTRMSIRLRWVSVMLTVLLGSSLTQWGMAPSGTWRNGGRFMFWSCVLMAATGAVGTWFYPTHRPEIIEQFKHYLLGVTVIPGTSLALINRAASGLFSSSPGAQGDAFLSVTVNALPLLMFATVVIPSVMFVKLIAGLRYLHRSRLDDEEAMLTYSRGDGYMA
jgi:hypothetical protein